MDYRKSYKWLKCGMASGAVIFLLGGGLLYNGYTILGAAFTISGAVLFLGGILQAAIYCHCPHCDYFSIKDAIRHITRDENSGEPFQYCPKCGGKLWEETE